MHAFTIVVAAALVMACACCAHEGVQDRDGVGLHERGPGQEFPTSNIAGGGIPITLHAKPTCGDVTRTHDVGAAYVGAWLSKLMDADGNVLPSVGPEQRGEQPRLGLWGRGLQNSTTSSSRWQGRRAYPNICVSTSLSTDQPHQFRQLAELAGHWTGPIAAAVYLERQLTADEQHLMSTLRASRHAAFAFVERRHSSYPAGRIRHRAMSLCAGLGTHILDVPVGSVLPDQLRENLERHVRGRRKHRPHHAYLLPARTSFEWCKDQVDTHNCREMSTWGASQPGGHGGIPAVPSVSVSSTGVAGPFMVPSTFMTDVQGALRQRGVVPASDVSTSRRLLFPDDLLDSDFHARAAALHVLAAAGFYMEVLPPTVGTILAQVPFARHAGSLLWLAGHAASSACHGIGMQWADTEVAHSSSLLHRAAMADHHFQTRVVRLAAWYTGAEQAPQTHGSTNAMRRLQACLRTSHDSIPAQSGLHEYDATGANEKVQAHRAAVLVLVTTYNRPQSLLDLLDEIVANMGENRVTVWVYDDASTDESGSYDAVRAHVQVGGRSYGWKYRRWASHFGKTRFIDLFNIMLGEVKAASSAFDYFYFLQDDVRLSTRFFDRSITTWDAIDDPDKATMMLLMDATRANASVWGSGLPVRENRGVERIQWVDMLFMADHTYVDSIDTMQPFPQERWLKNPALSTGVGYQATKQLASQGRAMYRVSQSLLVHRGSPSKMNSLNRPKESMLTANFVDGPHLCL